MRISELIVCVFLESGADEIMSTSDATLPSQIGITLGLQNADHAENTAASVNRGYYASENRKQTQVSSCEWDGKGKQTVCFFTDFHSPWKTT